MALCDKKYKAILKLHKKSVPIYKFSSGFDILLV